MATKNNDDNPVDNSFEYAMSQRGNPVDDPLAAIKTMRLEQLAVCRLKAVKEMQAMGDKATKSKVKTDD
ncbi:MULTISPECIES: hypothetical protein [Shewanella]|jgi:hypothetical protein|uniref:Uncharacterized protein n=1 Tax=Shewanella psychromarinicola TaxID=2487742 RepID=A0A3N4ETN3_9GAMM|nr:MULTISPECIES: hypothetical protein [Shewanella]AZG34395.1 hypothetical protein EGC80_05265 [Shewanella psychromarinicola]MCL1082054.1 hypothetical protein [Shewanella psychromarinicola]PKG79397.1 hypothetical protein CXF80_14370 [Shewanella sp. Actino-trap-3]RPA32494.1 hypothetical protein EGC77_11885 [Shewanella psychromarinicola]